VTEENILRGYS